MRQVYVVLIPCLLTGVLGACYRYAPVETPKPGMEVRAQLEADAAARRSQGLDEPVLWYDGVIVELSSEQLSLDVVVARSTSAFQAIVIRDTVSLQRAEVRSLRQRTLSPFRTALLVVGLGVGAFAAVKSIEAVVGGTDDNFDDDTPPAAVFPVFSLHPSRLLPWLFSGARDQ